MVIIGVVRYISVEFTYSYTPPHDISYMVNHALQGQKHYECYGTLTVNDYVTSETCHVIDYVPSSTITQLLYRYN